MVHSRSTITMVGNKAGDMAEKPYLFIGGVYCYLCCLRRNDIAFVWRFGEDILAFEWILTILVWIIGVTEILISLLIPL